MSVFYNTVRIHIKRSAPYRETCKMMKDINRFDFSNIDMQDVRQKLYEFLYEKISQKPLMLDVPLVRGLTRVEASEIEGILEEYRSCCLPQETEYKVCHLATVSLNEVPEINLVDSLKMFSKRDRLG